jgi:hypothetical protein
MAKIVVTAMCNGTQTKVSKKGTNYTITEFVEVSEEGMHTFSVFGDLGLKKDLTLKEYELSGQVVTLSNVKAKLAGSK